MCPQHTISDQGTHLNQHLHDDDDEDDDDGGDEDDDAYLLYFVNLFFI